MWEITSDQYHSAYRVTYKIIICTQAIYKLIHVLHGHYLQKDSLRPYLIHWIEWHCDL